MGAALVVLWTPAAQAQPQPVQMDVVATTPQPTVATGPQLSLDIEPGIAAALSDPQSSRTDAGSAQTVKVLIGLTRYFEVGPAATFTTLSSSSAMTSSSGSSWSFGGGARLMRPHDAAIGRRGFYAMSPWVDADMLYVRTGPLNRAGFAAGAGLAFPIDDSRHFWIGPYVRYFQIMQGDAVGYADRDAKIFNVGISLDVRFDLEHKRERVATTNVVAVIPVIADAPVAAVPDPDRDHDGVPDKSDICPDAAGPVENSGCPVYAMLTIKPDKLELKEKISFHWNSAQLDDASRPVLDEVATALTDNVGFTVQVDGNASSDGDAAYNQTLSEQRAVAVVDYLVARGIAKDRLVSKGFGSSAPVSTNSTVAGRELNRRVEFIVNFIILKKANTP